ncbi:unnamed protein product [Urochloa humidicola]
MRKVKAGGSGRELRGVRKRMRMGKSSVMGAAKRTTHPSTPCRHNEKRGIVGLIWWRMQRWGGGVWSPPTGCTPMEPPLSPPYKFEEEEGGKGRLEEEEGEESPS